MHNGVNKWLKVGKSGMFIGEYSHTLDAKGRIIIPSKFRDELHTSFILTRGLDGCLTIYSLEQWQKLLTELERRRARNERTRLMNQSQQ